MFLNLDKFILYLLFVVCTIDLPSPFIVYGTQFIGLFIICLLVLIRCGNISLRNILLWIMFTLFFISITCMQGQYLEYASLIWKFAIRIVFWFFAFAIIQPFIANLRQETVVLVLKKWIFIYGFLLFVQFFLFYTKNILIDYSVLIGGEPSRILNDVGLRASGLAAEPSIFSGIMLSMMILLYLLEHKNSFYSYWGALSILCTLSTLGFILVAAYILITSIKKITLGKIIFSMTSLALMLVILSPMLYLRYEKFMNGDDVSNNVKIEVIEKLLNDPSIFMLGFGVIGNSETAPPFYQALYDLTIFGNLIVIFGVPLGVVFVLCLAVALLFSKFSIHEKLLIILALIKITIPNYIFFYLFTVMLFYIHQKNKRFI